MIDKTKKVPPSFCVNCGKKMDAATMITKGHFPKPGDCGICYYCGEILVFNDRLLLDKPNFEQMEILSSNAENFALIRAAQGLIRSRAVRAMLQAAKN